MARAAAMACLVALLAGGCTSSRETEPARTATEQLLISSAADRAAARLNLNLPAGTRVFLDAANFEGTDARYAIGAIRDQLLRQGAALVPERKDAEAVVEIRAGALSIDRHKTLFGIPEFNIPIPATGSGLAFPEIALYRVEQRRAIAKFAAAGYGAKDGRHIGSTDPQYGMSHQTEWTVLVFIGWSRTDAIPREAQYSPFDVKAPDLP